MIPCMQILVTGGTGVIGVAAIDELLRRQHSVRLLSRHADSDAGRWTGVEGVEGEVSDGALMQRAASGCDALIHIAGIVAEEPPDVTFETINVEGTRHAVEAALQAGVRRFIFISSLGADTGASDYHVSKRAAEEIVKSAGLNWTIVRPANVYGPGDEVISLILRLVRSLPFVPVVGDGKQPFQPIWHEDAAKALAAIVERDDLSGRVLEIAGNEVTSMSDILKRFDQITERTTRRIPIPSALAGIAATIGSLAGSSIPFDQNKLTMLMEGNVIPDDRNNALTSILAITPTPLDRGLRSLVDSLPEQAPEEGVGRMSHKRYWADIEKGRYSAPELITMIRSKATELMPVEFEAEPDTPQQLDLGATLTAALPMRGNVQVRVEAVETDRIVLATLKGHPLAGFLQFSAEEIEDGVRFAVDTFTRAANRIDQLAMKTIGASLQDSNWENLVTKVIEASGGAAAEGVQTSSDELSDAAAGEVGAEFGELVQERQRMDRRESARPRSE